MITITTTDNILNQCPNVNKGIFLNVMELISYIRCTITVDWIVISTWQSLIHQKWYYGSIKTRKLSYPKDYRAMRPIWVPWKFSRVPEYAHAYFCRNF